MKFEVREYISKTKRNYFRKWLESLDASVQAKIQARIFRFEMGNLGDYKSVGRGVYEARFMFGSGYRVYFGIYQGEIVILLCAGNKASQLQDIKHAQMLYKDFLEQECHGTKK